MPLSLPATPITSVKPPPSRAVVPKHPHDNCFDVLRLLLAVSVLYSHSYYVGGFGDEGFLRFCKGQTIAGTIGVLGFFGLSGFLVGSSYSRCPTTVEFLRRRALRIFPGFWVCLLFTAFVATPLIVVLKGGATTDIPWLGANGALHYVVSNSLLFVRQANIGEILAGQPQVASINGSLWSLFPEACCYLALSFIGLCGALHRQRGLLILGTATAICFHLVHYVNPSLGVPTLPTCVALTSITPYVVAFFTGVAVAAYRENVVLDARGAALLGVALLAALKFGGFFLIAPVVLPLFLLHLGHAFSCRLRHDFSYGLYIYGFVAQQIVAALPLLRSSASVFFVASSSLALALAVASWFGVERRFLARSAAK